MTLILTIEIHVPRKRAYLTYSAIKVAYTDFTKLIDCNVPLLIVRIVNIAQIESKHLT